MRVQFDATLDDCVDTWARASKYSRSSRHWLWSEYFFGMILAGVSTAGLLHFLNIAPGRDNTVAALIGGGLAAIAYPWGAWWYTRNRIRESIRESVGTKPFSVEVELLPDGIGAKQNGAQIKY